MCLCDFVLPTYKNKWGEIFVGCYKINSDTGNKHIDQWHFLLENSF